nr:aminotransferase class III-fold pyridoxal phosphate-dependent enzyme [Sphingomonas bacterium]
MRIPRWRISRDAIAGLAPVHATRPWRADILSVSKGLTGGAVPLAVTMATEAIFAAHWSTDRARMFFHSSSYTANPIACAAANADLAIWRDEPVIERVTALAGKQRERLDTIAALPRVRNARSPGTITAFELDDPAGDYLSDLGTTLRARYAANDLLLRPLGNTIYVMPPYCVDDDDLDRIYAGIAETAE